MGDNVGHGTLITGVTPGVGTDIVAQPLPYTWLSLDRYAQILGIGLCNFNGAVATPFWPVTGCQDVFYRYGWQNNERISRDEIAQAIKSAEDDISQAVGFPLAPTWIAEEVQSYPRFYRREYYAGIYDVRSQYCSVTVDWHKTIGGGIRGLTLVQANVAVTYYDLDADGFFETARVTSPTTLTDVQEIKVYFPGLAGAQEWEIRPPKSKSIAAGVFTADFWTWQMIDPDEQSEFPSSSNDPTPIDLSGNPPTHVVGTVDIYREYHDETQRACEFWWEPEPMTGCVSLANAAAFYDTIQAGYLLIRDAEDGQVTPMVATYDATAGWLADSLTFDREPDTVKLWYRAGAIDQKYLKGKSHDPLSDQFALWIAMVATARLERTICECACGTTANLFAKWREDISEVSAGTTRYIDFSGDILSNPLGTHRGEVEVWKKIRRYHVSLGGAGV